MRVLVVALAIVASNIADYSDGSLLVENRRSVDIVTRLSELQDDLANTRIRANTAAYNASVQAVAGQTAKIMKMKQDISRASEMLSNLNNYMTTKMESLKTNIKGHVDDAISGASTAANGQMDDISTLVEKSKNDLATETTNLEKTLSTKIQGVKTSDEANKPLIVGWKECAQWGASGADRSNRYYHFCEYTKKRDDTVLVISANYDTRQINGNSIWKMRVDKMPCRHTNGAAQGDLKYRLHGSRSVNLHRPMYIKGACWKLSNGKTVAKGKHRIDVFQEYLNSDSYYNWESTARIMIEEVKVDEKPTITPNPPGNGWS